MKTKYLALTLICLLLIILPLSSADTETYKPNQKILLAKFLSNQTGNVANANCSTEIRNESLASIAVLQMNHISGGWYNATYNTSIPGYYYCSQNCTIGTTYTAGTCNFKVQGDNMSFAIVALLFAVSLMLFLFYQSLSDQSHWALKILLILLSFSFLVTDVWYGYLALDAAGASAKEKDLISGTFYVLIWLLVFFVLYIFIMLFAAVFKWVGERFAKK